MINLNDCYLFGTLSKPHGIKGNVTLRLNRFTFDDIEEMESVFILIDGLPVPFFVLEYSEKPPDSLVILFEDVFSEEKAREICGSEVYISKSNIRESQVVIPQDFTSLIGFQVIDQRYGPLGHLEKIMDIVQNPMMQISTENKEILLPLQPEFIVSVNEKKKIINVITPPGLIDLY